MITTRMTITTPPVSAATTKTTKQNNYILFTIANNKSSIQTYDYLLRSSACQNME
jgi:hypothetical protein